MVSVKRKIHGALVFLLSLAITASAFAGEEGLKAPLMGRGTLAILSVSTTQVHLVNIRTASERDGVVYYDQHVRLANREIAGDPPFMEFVLRSKADCNQMRARLISSVAQNFHTLEQAQEAWDFADSSKPEPIRRDAPAYSICLNLNSGSSLQESLTANHDQLIEQFPVYALSYRDAFNIDTINELSGGTDVSESDMLSYLREHNPNF